MTFYIQIQVEFTKMTETRPWEAIGLSGTTLRGIWGTASVITSHCSGLKCCLYALPTLVWNSELQNSS